MAKAGHDSRAGQTIHAITFDMDTTRMEKVHPGPGWRNGHTGIGNVLRDHGFSGKQGSVYVGDESVTAVTCVLAIRDLAFKLQCFGASVRHVRMLRIEAFDDPGPALGRGGEPA